MKGVVLLLCAPHATYAFLQAGCRHAERPEEPGGLHLVQVLYTNGTYQWMYHPFQLQGMGKGIPTCKHRRLLARRSSDMPSTCGCPAPSLTQS